MLADELRKGDWAIPLHEVEGWHQHPSFTAIWADATQEILLAAGTRINEPGTALVFSVHGTPLRYIEEGSRYVADAERSEEHTSELQSRGHLVCRLLLEKKKEL